MPAMTLWGRNIDRLVRERKLRRGAVASNAGVKATQLSDLINHESNPEIATLEKIARALGVPLAELFRDEGATSAPAPPDTRAFRSALRQAFIDILSECHAALAKAASQDEPPADIGGQTPITGPDEPESA